jgi:hypothetical protein
LIPFYNLTEFYHLPEAKDDAKKKKKKRKLPDDPEKIKAQIQKLDARLNALRLKKQDKVWNLCNDESLFD